MLQKNNKINATKVSEDNWSRVLGTNYSISFWDKIYKLPYEANLENKIKFLQIQINLHALPTNFSVNKYNALTSPNCTFCNSNPEHIAHLFYGCRLVQNLFKQIRPFLAGNLIAIVFNRRFCLFGSYNSRGDSCENIIVMLARGYIWRQKARKSIINFDTWKLYIKNKLDLQKLGSTFSANPDIMYDFDTKWSTLLLNL